MVGSGCGWEIRYGLEGELLVFFVHPGGVGHAEAVGRRVDLLELLSQSMVLKLLW